MSHVLDGGGRLEGSEEAIGIRNVEFLGNSSWRELGQGVVEPQMNLARRRPRSWLRLASSRMISVWSADSTVRRLLERKAATATENASLGSFFSIAPC